MVTLVMRAAFISTRLLFNMNLMWLAKFLLTTGPSVVTVTVKAVRCFGIPTPPVYIRVVQHTRATFEAESY